jgi:cytoskeletal protein RodZ
MKSVGSILKSARGKRGLSYEEIQRETKIHPRFLHALEEGNYSVFSSPVHIKGFLRTYTRFLGLDEKEVMAFFRREYDEKRVQGRVRGVKPLRGSRVFWTPGWIVGAVGVALIFIFLGYLLWNYRRYAGAPFLAVDAPASDTSTKEELIEIRGRASKGAEVTLNGKHLSLSEDGQFRSVVPLAHGVNTLEFIAVNPFGREARITRTVVVETP